MAAAKKPKPQGSSETPSRPERSKVSTERIHRSKLVEADYNPRTIDEWAFKKLCESVKKFGLVEPPVWNRRSGLLVGGHQRLRALDKVKGTTDYEVDVSVVDMDPKRERALNVVLNNRSIQGDYDLGKLQELIGPGGMLKIDDVLFESIEIEDMYVGTEWEMDFTLAPPPAEVTQVTGDLHEMAGRTADGEVIRDPAAHAAVKQAREEARERMAATNAADDSEFYIIVVCRSRQERESVMLALGKGANEKYLNGPEMLHRLGVESGPAPAESAAAESAAAE